MTTCVRSLHPGSVNNPTEVSQGHNKLMTRHNTSLQHTYPPQPQELLSPPLSSLHTTWTNSDVRHSQCMTTLRQTLTVHDHTSQALGQLLLCYKHKINHQRQSCSRFTFLFNDIHSYLQKQLRKFWLSELCKWTPRWKVAGGSCTSV